MPYFSFSLKKNFLINNKLPIEDIDDIVENKIYFSKNTHLWKILNKNKNKNCVNFVKYERRRKIIEKGKKILFCLPPSIGLGDAIEYALAIKAVSNAKKFEIIAIAFVGRFKYIFSKYFNLHNIYQDYFDEKVFNNFDTVFHFTLEIKMLLNQKYLRGDIENSINNFFNTKKYRKKIPAKNKQIKKITIFPISKSPLRSMPIKILNKIIKGLVKSFIIEVVLDNNSLISDFISNSITSVHVKKLTPFDLKGLCKVVENTEYGIFMDSGPLHLAKILNKKGIIIISSVGKEILLSDFNSIKSFENNYKSKYCEAPCGLTNIFNYNKKNGCYDSLKINFNDLMKLNSTRSLQRGNVKDSYVDFIKKPVSCLSNINVDKLIKEIKQDVEII